MAIHYRARGLLCGIRQHRAERLEAFAHFIQGFPEAGKTSVRTLHLRVFHADAVQVVEVDPQSSYPASDLV